jgi:hypothetical protein
MGFKVREDAGGVIVIYQGAHAVGWIREQAIGFHGFPSRAEAERAMTKAYNAIGRRLAWSHSGRKPDRRLVVDRLWPETGTVGFEVKLPAGLEADDVLRAARVAYHAVLGHGT